jgi:uncharacterized protein (TIGR02271 family)
MFNYKSRASFKGRKMRDQQDTDKKGNSGVRNRTSVSRTVPVMREEPRVEKKLVNKNKVRVEKKVREEKVTVEVPLIEEDIDVKRIQVNRYINSPPPVRHEGNTTIIPVLKEVVEKRLVLVEEVHITRKRIRTKKEEEIILRKEEIDITHPDPEYNPDKKENSD